MRFRFLLLYRLVDHKDTAKKHAATHLNRRQENSKRAALPELTLHLDPPPVILNDCMRGVESKPQATRNTFVYFGREAGFEHAHE